MIDVDLAVRARRRLVRGVTPARLVAAFVAYGILLGVGLSLPATFRDADPIITVPLAFGVPTAAAILAFRIVGRLRTGDRRVAMMTLGAAIVALGGGALVVAAASEEGDEPVGDSPFAFAGAFLEGLGRSVARMFYGPYEVNPPTIFPLLLVLLSMLIGSSFALRLKNHPSRWLRSPVLRWSLMLTIAVLIIVGSAVWIDIMFDERAPLEAVGALAVAPFLVLAGLSSLEVLRPRFYNSLPPAWEPASVGRRRRVWTGRRLPVVVVLWLLAMATIPAYFFLTRGFQQFGQQVAADPETTSPEAYELMTIVFWSFSLLVLLVGYQLHTAARRRAALDAATVRMQDDRPWLLYLRSFADDDVRVFGHGSPRRSFFERMLRRRERLEVVLTWHLWRFGPVIGVGLPGERVPRLGSAREYLSETEWREQIEERIVAARAIVVVLGRTEGLAWELETIERLGAGHRTIIVVPPLPRRELERRWEAFDDIARRVGWSPIPEDQRTHALIAVAPGGSQHGEQTEPEGAGQSILWSVFAGSARDEWHYEVAMEAALQSLENHGSTSAARDPGPMALEQPVESVPEDPQLTVRPSSESGASSESGTGHPPRDRLRRVAPAILLVIYLQLIVAVGASGETEIVNDVRPGTCVREFDPELLEEGPHMTNRVEVVSCDTTDSLEVYGNEPIDAVMDFTTFPGAEEVVSRAEDFCAEAFEMFYGISYEESTDYVFYWAPTHQTWIFGDDDVVCARSLAR